MTNEVLTNTRYSTMVTGLTFLKVIPQIFENKEGKKYPWNQLITIDSQGDLVKMTFHRETMIPDIDAGTPIIVYTEVDKYKKEKVTMVELVK